MKGGVGNALFVGGGTGAGKTTVARSLATAHGLRVLHLDSFWYEHAERAGENPPDPDTQWLTWTPGTQAADFERVSRRMLGYVLDDLPALPDQPVVIVEGPQVLPDQLPPEAHAVFLAPTPAFQERVLAPRPMPSSDPDRALAARLIKDRLYAGRVASLARECGFPVIEVDGAEAPDVVAEQVAKRFEELLRTSEPRGLQAVRRWENENTVRNVRAWVASGDSRASAEMAVSLACECGRLGCGARVRLTLAGFDATEAQAVMARDHRS